MPGRIAHASHIVLETKEYAETLVSKINNSRQPCEKVFAKYARTKSICASGKENCGDLGWIYEDECRTLREISSAVWKQETKIVGLPVKTGRGFHIILVHERH